MQVAAPAEARTPTAVPAGKPVIELVDLVHRYGKREALGGVSFTVNPGEIFGVLGPNGGGKSTLFRILSTMIPATGGTVRLFGRDPDRDLTAVRRGLGVVFQSPSLDLMLNARENLLHQGHLYGLHGKALDERMSDMLEQVGLADRAAERISQFSGGMRRRLEIAKALLHRPELLILDEPSTGLDPGARRDMWEHLRRMREAHGVTIIFTTHLMDEAEVCDRLALLDAGRLVALDTPGALKDRVGGDVITMETEDPVALARDVGDRFHAEASVMGDRVRLERRDGHAFLTDLVEAFPGRIRSVSVGQPTLEDVFIDLTGHRFEEAEAEDRARREAERKKKRRGGRR
jgi:ABC-2 type transport system ATP-binding protein